ncbi:VanZ family protein [Sulfuricurvum sp.]|uniref:VanZ family protein n=1 Tax=Sulfuricurvum sp. TaxID=2025608 RepID=UPI003C64D773
MTLFYRLLFLGALLSISILALLPNYNALPPIVSVSDLLNHAAAFVLLSFLYTLAYSHSFRRIALTLIGYGLLIELVQAFLPTRFASIEDVIADSVGILAGLAGVKMFRSLRERKRVS